MKIQASNFKDLVSRVWYQNEDVTILQ